MFIDVCCVCLSVCLLVGVGKWYVVLLVVLFLEFPVSFSRAPGNAHPRALLAGWAASSSEWDSFHSLPHISRCC